MTENSGKLTRRGSLQLMLGVTALGLALGKRSVGAKEVSNKLKGEKLSAKEKSIYYKLTQAEQSLFLKLDAGERSQYIKLTNDGERSDFLKHNAD